MIFPRATSLIAILSVVLAFGILVCGSPVLTEKRLVSIAVDQAYDILSKLKSNASKQYSKIDAHRANGTDATEEAEKIVQLFDSATARIKELPKDSNCPLNDKCSGIVDLLVQIRTDLVKCAKFEKQKTSTIGGIPAASFEQVKEMLNNLFEAADDNTGQLHLNLGNDDL
ncbi:hypothetical protein RSOLAG1IB_09418 [Rhizoctonia solani AG-1 IB]|uniref:Hydrophobic surface binding protein A domain-containing protein n=1 Tax=Thanatephorus cucumeris (strain AG1-IB / isolate 7/3/14) TaxID=1108050 RepID=M5C5G5_THACB|nr:hypothetical protein BN14_08730 [Rhizoctonia solani AG-1 IB]CEL60180.1 hypothetical protein RSOLAG1IB_09418 [Rhizoctonia solani AG-1 IB]